MSKHRAEGPARFLHGSGGRHAAGKHKKPSLFQRFLNWLDRHGPPERRHY